MSLSPERSTRKAMLATALAEEVIPVLDEASHGFIVVRTNQLFLHYLRDSDLIYWIKRLNKLSFTSNPVKEVVEIYFALTGLQFKRYK